MKTIFLFITILFAQISFAQTCTHEKKQGLQMFVFSAPGTYKSLGKVKVKLALTGEPKELLNTLIKKTLKEYKEANAILITSENFSEAEAIVLP